MPERLTRLDSVFEQTPIYFITACIVKRQDLLANQAAHGCFRKFAEAASDHGAWVGKYVLMPDHIHLFVALDDEQLSLSRWMKALKGTLSSHFRAAHLPRPYWQKGFFDHVLRGGESYSEKWQYVHENPVRAGLVTDCQEWPYQGEIFDLEFRRDRV